eukprot:scaffold428999_cov46-Prasinocladus_malaysianus.AAC.2
MLAYPGLQAVNGSWLSADPTGPESRAHAARRAACGAAAQHKHSHACIASWRHQQEPQHIHGRLQGAHQGVTLPKRSLRYGRSHCQLVAVVRLCLTDCQRLWSYGDIDPYR